jgi:hypothetical protein
MQWTRATFFALAMTTLGRAIQIANGELGRPPHWPIAWLSGAILLTALGVFLNAPLPIGRQRFQFVVGICLLINFAQLMTKIPCQELSRAAQLPYFRVGAVAAFLCGLIAVVAGKARLWAFMGLLATTAYLGNWAIVNCPSPHIDVYVFQRDSGAALLQGQNPYAITFPNIFAPDTRLYGVGVVQHDRLQFGYPYFPETLLAIVPPQLLGLDVRYTNLLAVLLSAILIVIISPGAFGFGAAILFLTTPRLCFVLEKSWIEPMVLLTLVATVACATRRPKLLPLALGLFLASKQYVPAAAVLFFVGRRPLRQTIILLIQAGIIGLIVSLPPALWNTSAFWHSVVELQFRQPFRPDALSYLSWVGQAFWSAREIVLIPFAALFLMMALVLWRRRSIGFAGAVAICFLLFFAFNKQAFTNYYFFIIGATACAIVELAPVRDISELSTTARPI